MSLHFPFLFPHSSLFIKRVLGVRHNLSPQQLLACDELSDYCQGGWPEAAYA